MSKTYELRDGLYLLTQSEDDLEELIEHFYKDHPMRDAVRSLMYAYWHNLYTDSGTTFGEVLGLYTKSLHDADPYTAAGFVWEDQDPDGQKYSKQAWKVIVTPWTQPIPVQHVVTDNSSHYIGSPMRWIRDAFDGWRAAHYTQIQHIYAPFVHRDQPASSFTFLHTDAGLLVATLSVDDSLSY